RKYVPVGCGRGIPAAHEHVDGCEASFVNGTPPKAADVSYPLLPEGARQGRRARSVQGCIHSGPARGDMTRSRLTAVVERSRMMRPNAATTAQQSVAKGAERPEAPPRVPVVAASSVSSRPSPTRPGAGPISPRGVAHGIRAADRQGFRPSRPARESHG